MDDNTRKTMFSSKSDEWSTPDDFYKKLNKEFGPFTLDPCASDENHKCKKYFTMEDNGLEQSWKGEKVFVNPPYSDVKSWIKKAAEETRPDCGCGYGNCDTLVVMLVPARTDTKWFHDFAMQFAAEIHFVNGRLKFGESTNSAPFPSMVLIFNKSMLWSLRRKTCTKVFCSSMHRPLKKKA